jgi:hypothetical protein
MKMPEEWITTERFSTVTVVRFHGLMGEFTTITATPEAATKSRTSQMQ